MGSGLGSDAVSSPVDRFAEAISSQRRLPPDAQRRPWTRSVRARRLSDCDKAKRMAGLFHVRSGW
jgi:hypothetical protein